MGVQSRQFDAAANPAPGALRKLLNSNRLEFLMEAHSGLSARIVQEAGFGGVWASGLAISTQLGLRDCNEASWSQIVDVVGHMTAASDLPVLVDGDTGYGDFNTARRFAEKLWRNGAAGVCLEDKLFPKRNSFRGERQPLADPAEVCGWISATRDFLGPRDFVIVARTEALVSGFGMDEALSRCEKYRAAGADAVLVHSKKAVADEVLTFRAAWRLDCPVVIVPTTYGSTPTEVFERAGMSVVIWANHSIRASLASMLSVARQMRMTNSGDGVEDRVCSLSDLFALMSYDQLDADMARYGGVKG